ncbi:hypothetical protein [Arthrobacter russicus]|uniref:Secreted protein n=1 Tax=Arthrobacter russicus TaxID=172040 RepID=A0ABU1J9R5_9MICC|nr:hypothetical protein [Arthrobacter russicus]MDR6269154.1 hypothetical protein [Arthrobacter russicus]
MPEHTARRDEDGATARGAVRTRKPRRLMLAGGSAALISTLLFAAPPAGAAIRPAVAVQGQEQIAFFGSVEECRAKEAYFRENLAIIVRKCGWAGESMPVSQRWYFTYRLT